MTEPNQIEPRRVVIVGGGISGLSAAHRLNELAAKSTFKIQTVLLEAGARLGGVIKTSRRDGFLLEAGPDSFISEKPETLALSNRLGLDSQLIETNHSHRRSFIVRHGKLRAVPEGFQLLAPSRFWPFVTSPIMSWHGKVRMAFDLVLPRRTPANGSDESLARFVQRRLGREALDRIAQPMIGGIYTADPERLSLRATMPRFLEMEREHRSLIRAMWKQRRSTSSGTSGARYSLFLSFDEGMSVLVDAIESRLAQVSIRKNAKVESIVFDAQTREWTIRCRSGETIRADAVCLALPADCAGRLLAGIDTRLADDLATIQYASTATINLAYRRTDISHPLDGFGFVVPLVEKRAILACTFSSVKFEARAPDNHVLLRAFVGGALQPEIFSLDESEMLSRIRADLRDLLGVSSAPIFSEVEKWPNSMAQYRVGHLELIARIRERLASHQGLSLAGNAFIGAGISDCIRSGENAAQEIFQLLSEPLANSTTRVRRYTDR